MQFADIATGKVVPESKAPDKLRLADDYLSVEPYALALPRGDSDFLKLAGLAKRVFPDQKYRVSLTLW